MSREETVNKNDIFGDIDERNFNFLAVKRTLYPNQSCLYELRARGATDERAACLEISARPDELHRELQAVVKWLEPTSSETGHG
jgi:hypothetical protein